jgi:hypothetical protein
LGLVYTVYPVQVAAVTGESNQAISNFKRFCAHVRHAM